MSNAITFAATTETKIRYSVVVESPVTKNASAQNGNTTAAQNAPARTGAGSENPSGDSESRVDMEGVILMDTSTENH